MNHRNVHRRDLEKVLEGLGDLGLGERHSAFHWYAGWDLKVMDGAALEIANRHAEFAVGHASAALNFQGWRARPIWNVLMFSADDPPTQRGLVRVDGITGEVVGSYLEDIDEV